MRVCAHGRARTIDKSPRHPRGMDSGSSVTLDAEHRKGMVVDVGSMSSEAELNFCNIKWVLREDPELVELRARKTDHCMRDS